MLPLAVAFCPAPPVLVPELAAGAAGELDDLRAHCRDVVADLISVGAHVGDGGADRGADRGADGGGPPYVVVVGPATGAAVRRYPGDAAGTFAGWGVDVRAGGAGPPTLPLSLSVGAWLLDRAGVAPRLRVFCAVGADVEAADVRTALDAVEGLGADDPYVVLAVGEGTAARTERAPLGLHPDAQAYDQAVADAISGGDVEALAGLGPRTDLGATGAASWAVLARSWTGARVRSARLDYSDAPYGVCYLVGLWRF